MPEVSSSNICIGCGLSIKDQYIYKLLPDMAWHESCLKCAECECKLVDNPTCFVRNNKAYCKQDYSKLFMHKCARCGEIVKKNDYFMKAKNSIYHTECFCCVICSKKLIQGEEYQIRDEQLYCKEDALLGGTSQLYLSNLSGYTSSTMAITPENSSTSFSPSTNSSSSSMVDSPCNYNTQNNSFSYSLNTHFINSSSSMNINRSEDDEDCVSDEDLMDNDEEDENDNSLSEESSLNESCISNGKNGKNSICKKNSNFKQKLNYTSSSNSLLKMHHKPARIRTVLNEKQLETLKRSYCDNPRPDAGLKEELVRKTGLNPRVIRVWFQNKRCKDKKKNQLGPRPDQQQAQQSPIPQTMLPQSFNANTFNSLPQFNFNAHHNHLNSHHPGQHNIMFDNYF